MSERKSKGFIWDIRNRRFGFEYSPITNYMNRWIAYFGWFNLRIHRFLRGDDERAPHDHPFWFVTVPTRSYYEQVMEEDGSTCVRKVQAWLPHFRKATFRHIVLGTEAYTKEVVHPHLEWMYGVISDYSTETRYRTPKPFLTFVLAGARSNGWGFWPAVDKFIPWREWK